ncbi:hypothetical protein V495_05622 [Pseudogymnoascus sp. VKM F-4514 (FW-929)]|nr:hypothetical protein V495_05622 [Pseudogymnoascus sp. VKM F-4514 (FW-929)]KFY57078.1 hypothetical protein V497_05756 [Pseudogymnoascus sp. VKM F-4516 (FW-969)]
MKNKWYASSDSGYISALLVARLPAVMSTLSYLVKKEHTTPARRQKAAGYGPCGGQSLFCKGPRENFVQQVGDIVDVFVLLTEECG